MIAGISAAEVWDWTPGEIIDQVLGCRERQRREHQAESVIAARSAYYGALALFGNGKPLPEVYELFPFWTEKEVKACKVEKYRAVMMRHAACSVNGGGEQSSQP